MSAGLAIVAILGGLISMIVVRPEGLFTTLATVSVGGSLITLAAALLADWSRGAGQAEAASRDEPVSSPAKAQANSPSLT